MIKGDIGFTGTQEGMTKEQFKTVCKILIHFKKNRYMVPISFHHGCCIGADEQSHVIASSLGYPIVLHPPINTSKKIAYPQWCYFLRFEPKPYLERNHEIVDNSYLLIAVPKGEEELRSGTWSTIRWARKQNKHILIIKPDGKITHE